MNDTIAYIERYFTEELTNTEKVAFEERCRSDALFADEVAFYLAARKAIKSELNAKKKRAYQSYLLQPRLTFFSKTNIVKAVLSVAAGLLIFVITYSIFFRETSTPQQLASDYISKDLVAISQLMGRSQNLQAGIAAYNNKQYSRALDLFNTVYKTDSLDRDAVEYAGYVYLITKEYDNAISQFEAVTNLKGKFNNGKFLKAVSLLKRNNDGDPAQAKKLLQEVVNENLGGKDEAERWLAKWKS